MQSDPRSIRPPYPKGIRNSYIETIALYASEQEQWNYEVNVPTAQVPSELLEFWGAFSPDELRLQVHFSEGEWNALLNVNRAMEWFYPVWERNEISTVGELLKHPKWQKVVEMAKLAMIEFQKPI